MITKEVSDKLSYYVYALVDPRNKQIFYIGKGKGNRVFEHALGIKSNEEDEDDSEKIALIKEILSAKQEVNKCHYTLGVVNGIVRGIYPFSMLGEKLSQKKFPKNIHKMHSAIALIE